ncbi:MAG: 16S rRNA (guanine(527)-N(7))-methyltransferase RsmG [Alphaproteobacteria bacterium]|nr:16S rRNA (guanine(527)-N(7))-methyltransferase RsmG [Alphaproteobacteria bacterium]
MKLNERDQIQKFQQSHGFQLYKSLLENWQKKVNLVASSTIPYQEQRHFEDSLQLLSYLPSDKISLVDLGSGAGFPGLVLALARPQTLLVTLIESDLKKCLFLETVSRETKVNVIILRSRIESLKEVLTYDVVTSRALAPLPLLLEYATPFLNKNSVCLFLKGKSFKAEIKDAKKKWEFDLEIFPSLTDSTGCILKIENLKRIELNDKNCSRR